MKSSVLPASVWPLAAKAAARASSLSDHTQSEAESNAQLGVDARSLHPDPQTEPTGYVADFRVAVRPSSSMVLASAARSGRACSGALAGCPPNRLTGRVGNSGHAEHPIPDHHTRLLRPNRHLLGRHRWAARFAACAPCALTSVETPHGLLRIGWAVSRTCIARQHFLGDGNRPEACHPLAGKEHGALRGGDASPQGAVASGDCFALSPSVLSWA